MELEEKKVLLKNRFNPFVSSKKKEWWYTGIQDGKNNIYLGFSVIRIMYMDSINITLFDPSFPEAVDFSWKGFLDSAVPPDQLSLKANGKKFSFSYTGDEKKGWAVHFEGKEISADLTMKPTIPWFTKFDNLFVDEYTLLHFFQNRVSGTIRTKNRDYTITDALSYYDHCFGTVPGKTKWHWIAVQNDTCCLASLMNYGAYAQCYTQVYFKSGADAKSLGRWIRLDQDVSFECYHHDRFDKEWRITSPDMDLRMSVIQTVCEKERVPPVIPFLINIDHYQCSVSVQGKIRVDGVWTDTGTLRGVLEEHHGKW